MLGFGSARIGDKTRGLGLGPGLARVGDMRRGLGLGFGLAHTEDKAMGIRRDVFFRVDPRRVLPSRADIMRAIIGRARFF